MSDSDFAKEMADMDAEMNDIKKKKPLQATVDGTMQTTTEATTDDQTTTTSLTETTPYTSNKWWGCCDCDCNLIWVRVFVSLGQSILSPITLLISTFTPDRNTFRCCIWCKEVSRICIKGFGDCAKKTGPEIGDVSDQYCSNEISPGKIGKRNLNTSNTSNGLALLPNVNGDGGNGLTRKIISCLSEQGFDKHSKSTADRINIRTSESNAIYGHSLLRQRHQYTSNNCMDITGNKNISPISSIPTVPAERKDTMEENDTDHIDDGYVSFGGGDGGFDEEQETDAEVNQSVNASYSDSDTDEKNIDIGADNVLANTDLDLITDIPHAEEHDGLDNVLLSGDGSDGNSTDNEVGDLDDASPITENLTAEQKITHKWIPHKTIAGCRQKGRKNCVVCNNVEKRKAKNDPDYTKRTNMLTWYVCSGCPAGRQGTKYFKATTKVEYVPLCQMCYNLRWNHATGNQLV